MAADQLNLQKVVEHLDPHCTGYHLDIMDHHFVHNLALTTAVVNALCTITRRQLWVHLMVEKPDEFIEKLFLPPGSIASFHFESTDRDENVAKRIKEKKWHSSIAINPKTDIDRIFPLLHNVDHVLLMSVEPGFSGQSFIASVEDKIAPLIGYRQTSNLSFKIAMDGGISEQNIERLAQKGVDNFAVANAIFKQPDPVAALQKLQTLVKEQPPA